MDPAPQAFRAACARFPTGVTIVTRVRDGVRLGVTVSSFTSVSLDPPMVLVCIHRRSSFLTGLAPGQALAINILAEHQSGISTRFATQRPENRFENDADWDRTRLRGAAAVLECEVAEILEAGDHTILLARVRDVESAARPPLVFCQSGYRQLVSF